MWLKSYIGKIGQHQSGLHQRGAMSLHFAVGLGFANAEAFHLKLAQGKQAKDKRITNLDSLHHLDISSSIYLQTLAVSLLLCRILIVSSC